MNSIAGVRRGSFPGFIELRGWGAYPAVPLKAAQTRTCNLPIKGADLSPAARTSDAVRLEQQNRTERQPEAPDRSLAEGLIPNAVLALASANRSRNPSAQFGSGRCTLLGCTSQISAAAAGRGAGHWGRSEIGLEVSIEGSHVLRGPTGPASAPLP
jgi:hypothetical protein